MAFVTIDGYPLDVVETEEHGLTAEITEHPVEDGSDISDNIRRKPRELTLTGACVSNTPTGAIASDPSRQFTPDGASPATDAWRRFEQIWLRGQPVVIVTDLKKYESMGLESLSNPVSAKNAGGLVVTARFKEVRIVKNKRVTIAVVNGGGRQNIGQRVGAKTDAARILWNKGKPPGRAPYTDPKGVITGSEYVLVREPPLLAVPGGSAVLTASGSSKRTQFTHESGQFAGLPLSDAELDAFALDLQRDTARNLNRGLATSLREQDEKIETTKRALELSDYTIEHPGAKADPAMFGLKQNPDGTFSNLPTGQGAKAE